MSATSFSPDVAASLSAQYNTTQNQNTNTLGASKEVFLQLLVAQIKNQNPLNPADGVEFMSQLAQFSQLEQLLSLREDLSAIRAAVESASQAAATSGAGTP